jgi:hydroxyacylglutathione hydrolase
VRELLEAGATLVDGRATREFDAEHVPGSVNLTMVRAAVGTRAAWVVDPQSDVALAAASDAEARRLATLLHAVGFRSIRGYLAGGLTAWRDAGLEIGSTEAIDPPELARRLAAGTVTLLDVREEAEWREGHVADSLHVPYHELRDGLPEGTPLDGRPVAVACSAGNRSSIAVSLLKRARVGARLVHVADGGVGDLERHGVPLVHA